MESLRGMKGVVASSGWGVARFIVLELGERNQGALPASPALGKLLVATVLLFYGTVEYFCA